MLFLPASAGKAGKRVTRGLLVGVVVVGYIQLSISLLAVISKRIVEHKPHRRSHLKWHIFWWD